MTGEQSRYAETRAVEKLEYPSHPFMPDLCTAIALMPPGFRDLALSRTLSSQMLLILERMSKFVQHVSRALKKKATPKEMYFLLLYKPHLVVQDAYVLLKSWDLDEGNSSIEPCLCYALIAFSWNVFNNQVRIAPVYKQLAQNLVAALEQFQAGPTETDCLIWMSMLAASHSRGNQALALRGPRRLDIVMECYPHTRNWQKLQKVLQKFFWYEPLAEEWELCWKAAMQRRTAALETGEGPREKRDVPPSAPPKDASSKAQQRPPTGIIGKVT